jgi:hypothetical protein
MGERGVGRTLGRCVNGKEGGSLLTFLGTIGVSRMVRCCISIVSITIFIFMTIISILTSYSFPTPMISISQLLTCPHRSQHSFLLVPLPSSLVRVPACRAGRTIALFLQDHLPCPWSKNSVQHLLKLRQVLCRTSSTSQVDKIVNFEDSPGDSRVDLRLVVEVLGVYLVPCLERHRLKKVEHVKKRRKYLAKPSYHPHIASIWNVKNEGVWGHKSVD